MVGGEGFRVEASDEPVGLSMVDPVLFNNLGRSAAGGSYGWLAQVTFTHDSWTAALDVRRVAPTDDAHAVAAEQIRALLGRLSADGPVPLCVFDAGYDSLKLARALGDLDGERVAVL